MTLNTKTFETNLYTSEYRMIGLRSSMVVALVILGIRQSLVKFHCLGKDLTLKSSWISRITVGSMTSQYLWKHNPDIPSAHGSLLGLIAKVALLISSFQFSLVNYVFIPFDTLGWNPLKTPLNSSKLDDLKSLEK